MEPNMIHIEAWMFGAVSAFVGLLLAIIAWFLSRGISKFDNQFDKLNVAVERLTQTIGTFDGDMKGMHQRLLSVERDVNDRKYDCNVLYQRVGDVEIDVASIKAGGCEIKNGRCTQ